MFRFSLLHGEGITIATLRDYPDYYKALSGYIKLSAVTEVDYREILERFQTLDLCIPEANGEELFRWFHYRADLFLLEYYNDKKASDTCFKERIKQKKRHLIDKLNTCYPEFLDLMNFQEYEVSCEMPPYHKLKRYFDALTESGYPNRVLIFYYRTLIDCWDIDRVIQELENKELDAILSRFINEYAEQSGLPTYLISLLMMSMKDKLNQKLYQLISKTDGVTVSKMSSFLDWISGLTLLRFYFGKDSQHDIPDWCNKVKTKAMKNIIDKMKQYE